MFAKLNHLAITSDIYAINARFYEALFGMKSSSKPRPARATPVGDGQIGLNNIPRREGRRSGLIAGRTPGSAAAISTHGSPRPVCTIPLRVIAGHVGGDRGLAPSGARSNRAGSD